MPPLPRRHFHRPGTTWFPPPLAFPHPALLDRFYLQSVWHGTGVAQTLLQAVDERARDYGIETLWLCHHPSNERAGRFYRRQEFQDTGVILPFTLAGWVYNDIVMVRGIREVGKNTER